MRVHRPRWATLGAGAAHAAQTGRRPVPALLDDHRLAGELERLRLAQGRVRRLRAAARCASAARNAGDPELVQRADAVAQREPRGQRLPTGAGAGRSADRVHHLSRAHRRWRLPIVDRDPKVPLSERDDDRRRSTARVIIWTGSRRRRAPTSSAQRFVGADGATVAPPTALLYVLLRHALLDALEAGTLEAAHASARRLFDVDRPRSADRQHRHRAACAAPGLSRGRCARRSGSRPTTDARWPTGCSITRARRRRRRSPRPRSASPKCTTRSPRWRTCRRRGSSACSPSMSTSARIGSMRGSPRSMPSAWQQLRGAATASAACTSARSAGSRTCDPRRAPATLGPRRYAAAGAARSAAGADRSRTPPTAASCMRRR